VIASISGSVKMAGHGQLIIDVGGVGFSINVPSKTASQSSVGQQIDLFTALIVREDAFTLFGFESAEQLNLFDLLRSVSGVGPKIALSAISSIETADIARAIANGDASIFEAVSGIGSKTAKLIVVTLAGKLASFSSTENSIERSLLEAMKSLGWHEKIALPAVRQVIENSGDFGDLQSQIKGVLSILGSQK
jgi:Holliday junction DNA helicase RuvA